MRYLAREGYKAALTRQTSPIPNFQRRLDNDRSIGTFSFGVLRIVWNALRGPLLGVG
jgi:hypothetical protein